MRWSSNVMYRLIFALLSLAFSCYIIFLSELTVGNVLAIVLSVFAINVAVFGWGVIYENAKRIACRNELHAITTSLMDKIDAVDKAGSEFWSGPASLRRQGAGQIMVRRFGSMTKSLKLLASLMKERGLNFSGFDSDVSALHDALTLDVEDADVVSELRCAIKIQKISSVSHRMRCHIYQEFLRNYPHVPH